MAWIPFNLSALCHLWHLWRSMVFLTQVSIMMATWFNGEGGRIWRSWCPRKPYWNILKREWMATIRTKIVITIYLCIYIYNTLQLYTFKNSAWIEECWLDMCWWLREKFEVGTFNIILIYFKHSYAFICIYYKIHIYYNIIYICMILYIHICIVNTHTHP